MSTKTRLRALEKRRLPGEVVCLSQSHFDTPAALYAESRRLQEDAAARGVELTVVCLLYDDDWLSYEGDTVRLSWGDEA